MALTDESNGNGFYMPVAPAYGGGYNNSGFGGFGGDWGWIVLLLLLAGGGWGSGFGGFGGGFGNMMLGYDFPWLLNGQNGINNNVSDGFRTAQISDGITSIRDGVSNLSTQLCNCCGDMQMSLANGFAGTNAAISGAQNAIANQLYSNEIASLNRSFAEQTANAQGFNNVTSQLAQCCCDNRLATANLQNVIQTENCADREALNYSTRDIIANQTAGIQRILDQMCNDKIDAKNERIADLERQLTMANLAASQRVQTQTLLADNAAQTNALEQYLAPVPRPAYIVQNPNCCANSGCGCNFSA